jgi:hypothetical protein
VIAGHPGLHPDKTDIFLHHEQLLATPNTVATYPIQTTKNPKYAQKQGMLIYFFVS